MSARVSATASFLAKWWARLPADQHPELAEDLALVAAEAAAVERRRLVTDPEAFRRACAWTAIEIQLHQRRN